MKKELVSLVLSVFLLSSSLIGLWCVPQVSAAGSHAPIYIYGNSAFTEANGVVSGDGTEGNPWVIENWIISAASSDGSGFGKRLISSSSGTARSLAAGPTG